MEKTKQNKFSISLSDLELSELEEVRNVYVNTVGMDFSRNAFIRMLLFEHPVFKYTENATAGGA
jgi:hypothetical protein